MEMAANVNSMLRLCNIARGIRSESIMRNFVIAAVIAFSFLLVSCKNVEITSAGTASQMSTPQLKPLTETEAIEFAEKFIEQNGYTDLPPDKDKLTKESIEWVSDTDEMLKMRHNTLERKAFGISHGRKGDKDGWTVVFKYKAPTDEQSRKNGRAVTMNGDGSKARVEHVDFILDKVDKKL